ncbi:SH3 domain containing protein [Amanita muscaria]
MRTAIKTSEELQTFWTQRAAIEEEFGKRLALLARMPVGADETGELRSSLQALMNETQRQAESHIQLASNVRRELVEPIARFHDKQIDRKRSFQSPIEKKFKAKQSQATFATKAREKYEGDISRIRLFRQQAGTLQGQDLERLQNRLRRALETVKANERDYAGFLRGLSDISAEWEVDWKVFCDNCQDLEEERMEFMKDNVWNYANMISTLCVNDDESCERIRTALDHMEPDSDLIAFVEAQGTGNRVTDPPPFVPLDPQKPSVNATTPTIPSVRTVLNTRISRKAESLASVAPTVATATQPIQNSNSPSLTQVPSVTPTIQRNNSSSVNGVQSREPQPEPIPVYEREPPRPAAAPTVPAATAPPVAVPIQATPPQVQAGPSYVIPPPPPIPEEPPRQIRRGTSLRRVSGPLPHVPGSSRNAPVEQPPPVPTQLTMPITDAGDRILFLVKALYDYRATIDEEFDFQTGDIIAVTETPDDGWWSGELLDEARREPGRHIFPSNYVCLF